jgi:tetratricopeptide (TPR) repeat protein
MNSRSYFTFLLLAAVFSFLSCSGEKTGSDKSELEQAGALIEYARALVDTHPDSVSVICNSIESSGSRNELPDSMRLDVVHIRANALSAMGMPDSAYSILSKEYNSRNKWPGHYAHAYMLYKLGWYSYISGHIPAAEKYIKNSVDLMEKENILKNRANLMTLYADILWSRGKFIEAQECLFKTVKIAEETRDTPALGRAYMGIGHVYGNSENRNNSLEYYKKAYYTFVTAKDNDNTVSALTNIGLSYRYSSPDSALHYYQLALNASSAPGNVRSRVIILYNMGNIYADIAQYEEAGKYFDETLKICRENGIASGIPKVYTGYAMLESLKQNYAKSDQYYSDAIEVLKSQGDIATLLSLLKGSLPLYEKTGDWKKWAARSGEIRVLEDSLLSAEKRMQLQDIAKSYEIEKREIENRYLSKSLYEQNLNIRLWLSLFILFAMAFTITAALYWFNKKLKKELESSYHILMDQYREEKRLRETMEVELTVASRYTDTTQKVLEYFSEVKPYLNPDIRANNIMEAVNISYPDFQKVLYELEYPNFKTMLNHYRVHEAVLKFEDPSYDHYTIEAIAKDAGFGSRARFYSTFESVKGVKPAWYRSQINTLTA